MKDKKKLCQNLTQIKAILRYSCENVLATWGAGQEHAEGLNVWAFRALCSWSTSWGANSWRVFADFPRCLWKARPSLDGGRSSRPGKVHFLLSVYLGNRLQVPLTFAHNDKIFSKLLVLFITLLRCVRVFSCVTSLFSLNIVCFHFSCFGGSVMMLSFSFY